MDTPARAPAGRQPLPGVLVDGQGGVEDEHGQGQAQQQLAQGLDDLGHAGGHHVHVALGIPPEAEQQVHSTAGGQGQHGEVRLLILEHILATMGENRDMQTKLMLPSTREGGQGHPEHPLLLVVQAQGVAFAHRLGQGHRQTGGWRR